MCKNRAQVMPNPIISSPKYEKSIDRTEIKKALSEKGLLKISSDGDYPPIEILLNSFTVSVLAVSDRS